MTTTGTTEYHLTYFYETDITEIYTDQNAATYRKQYLFDMHNIRATAFVITQTSLS